MKFNFGQYEIIINNIWKLLLPMIVGLFSIIYSFRYNDFQFYSLFILGAINVLIFLINIKKGFKNYGRKEKNGRGGYRPNAGRPKKKEEDKLQRTAHAIRAFEDEWKLIQRFINLVRKDKVKCEQAIKLLEMK